MPLQLSPKQERSIAESTAPVNIWDGAVRSGKTIASMIRWLHFVETGPPGPLMMIGKTLGTLERNILDPMQEILLPRWPGAIQHTRLTNRARIFGRYVHVMGADDRTAEHKIRGLTLAGAYVDEASLTPHEFWLMLRTRLSLPDSMLFATTNPDSPNHWLKRDVIDRVDELGFRRWHFLLTDNPGLPEAYVRQLKLEMAGLFYRRYILGEWTAAHGAIYDMLDLASRHRVTWTDVEAKVPLGPEGQFWLGVDYGDQNPFHAVLIALGLDQRLYAIGEWRWDGRARRRQKTTSEYSDELSSWLRRGAGIPGLDVPVWPKRVAPDPTAAEFRTQLRRDRWHGIVTPKGGVIDGIQAISSLLARDRLVFVEGACPELEAEMGGYVWDEDQQLKGIDAPLKVDDHGPDGLRYGIMACSHVWRTWLSKPLPEEEVALPDRPLARIRPEMFRQPTS